MRASRLETENCKTLHLTCGLCQLQICNCRKNNLRAFAPAGRLHRTTIWRYCLLWDRYSCRSADYLTWPCVLLVLLHFHEWHLGSGTSNCQHPLMDQNWRSFLKQEKEDCLSTIQGLVLSPSKLSSSLREFVWNLLTICGKIINFGSICYSVFRVVGFDFEA